MPRYLFQYADGTSACEAMSRELRDTQDMRLEAIVYAAETLSSHPEIVWTGHDLDVLVSDEVGILVCTVKVTTQTIT